MLNSIACWMMGHCRGDNQLALQLQKEKSTMSLGICTVRQADNVLWIGKMQLDDAKPSVN